MTVCAPFPMDTFVLDTQILQMFAFDNQPQKTNAEYKIDTKYK